MKLGKYFLLSSLFFYSTLISTKLNSQTYGTTDSHWTYDQSWNSIFEVGYSNDTLLNNQIFNKYAIRSVYLNNLDTMVWLRENIFINNKDGLVTFSLDMIEFDTLINYNAAIGEGWSYVYRERDTFELIVIDTFTTELNSSSIYGMFCEFVNKQNNRSILDTIYETIGSINNFIIPYYGWGDIGGFTGGHLRCYENADFGSIDFGQDDSDFIIECGETTSYSYRPSSTALDDLDVWPNPFQSEIFIDTELKEQLLLYNIYGKLLFRGEFSSGIPIDLSHLDIGVYFARVGSRMIKLVKAL